MKKVTLYSILCLLLIGAIYSCSKDEGQQDVCEQEDSVVNFSIRFNPVLKGEEVELYKRIEDVNGYPFMMEMLTFYVSNLKLVDSDNKEHLLRDIALLEFSQHSPNPLVKNLEIKMVAPVGKFKGIKFGIGVDEDHNLQDPNIFEKGHPYSASNSMHWNWKSGYMFLKLHGRTDATDDNKDELVDITTFHSGLNELYKAIDLSGKEFEITKDQKTELVVKVDIDKFFKSDDDLIDFKDERITDVVVVNYELGVRFANLYAKAFSIE